MCDLCCRWSLLEKYSCKASKLHLKPRRFKIFIEALVSRDHLYTIVECFPAYKSLILSASTGLTSFIFAMKEHQLLKDQKKNIRKRPSQGGNCSFTTPNTVSSQSRAAAHDSRAVKLVLVESQNVQKLSPGKGSSLKRNANVSVHRSNSKGDSSSIKTRQRQKPGYLSVLFP